MACIGFLTSSCSLESACANTKNSWADGGNEWEVSRQGWFLCRVGMFGNETLLLPGREGFFLPRLSAFVGFWGFFASSALKGYCSTSRAWCMGVFGIQVQMN